MLLIECVCLVFRDESAPCAGKQTHKHTRTAVLRHFYIKKNNIVISRDYKRGKVWIFKKTTNQVQRILSLLVLNISHSIQHAPALLFLNAPGECRNKKYTHRLTQMLCIQMTAYF